MVAGGLNATRKTSGAPLVRPPCTPPLRLVSVRRAPGRSPAAKASLCSLPRIRAPANPLPSSKPLLAGTDSMAPASRASVLPNTGSPQPAGRPRTAQATTPPTESCASRAATTSAVKRSAAAGSGQRTGWASTAASVTTSGSTAADSVPTASTQATTSTPHRTRSSCRATAPAATRAAVSRALARPPPLRARRPYLAW